MGNSRGVRLHCRFAVRRQPHVAGAHSCKSQTASNKQRSSMGAAGSASSPGKGTAVALVACLACKQMHSEPWCLTLELKAQNWVHLQRTTRT